MSDKLLTVIVPSYNMEEYLPKCLGSLIVPDEAMLQRLDVIVVNDGSKDRTSEIAHDFEKRYPGVFRVIDKANGNYGSCINAALPEAKGQYVKILDADDSVEKKAFESLLGILKTEADTSSGSADLILCDFAKVSPDGKVTDLVSLNIPCYKYMSLPESGADNVGRPFVMANIVYKRTIFSEINYHQTEGISYTDIEWSIEPMCRVHRVLYLPVAVNQYLLGRPGQTMQSSIYAERYWQIVDIVCGLAERYETRMNQCTQSAKSFYRARMRIALSEVYQRCLFGLKTSTAIKKRIGRLERIIEGDRELYTTTNSIRFPSRILPIKFIWAWRHRWGSGMVAFWGLKAFLFIRFLIQAKGIFNKKQ
jgi:glycosyltransferase involved in cell wall biosynthesis